ncbi:MAG: glutaredoxin domain-containing protein [Anaerolineae bacterium]|nr:glutaredoxin domain-containing protein [Anaerolineae bacterium]
MSEKSKKITMYAHPACPMVFPVKSMLKQAKADYDYINIFEDMAARDKVRDINNGYESVPTLLFPDGSTLTEPSAGELRNKLQSMGYKVPLTAMLMGNLWLIVIVAGVVFAILRALGVF